MIKDNETDFLLDTLAAMCIAQYCFSSCLAGDEQDLQWDQSLAVYAIVKTLKERGVNVPEALDSIIKEKDFTNMLTSYGSGNRERGFVIEYIEEVYDEPYE